jgi:hypothetical protein
MVDAFDEVSFLTRSANRVEVLSVLARGTYSERELVAETGISEVTVGRILEDFRERAWVVEAEEEEGYRASAVGELLVEDYRRFEESMGLAARLGPVLDILPVETMDFDLRLLAEGRVSDPDTFDPLAAVDRWKQLLWQSDEFLGVAPAATATTVVTEPYHEAVTDGDLDFTAVVSPAYYDAVQEQDRTRRLVREELEAGAEMYLADIEGDFSVSVAAFDDVATITGYDEAGRPRFGIESRAEPVREWVRARFDFYREDATPLAPADFDA